MIRMGILLLPYSLGWLRSHINSERYREYEPAASKFRRTHFNPMAAGENGTLMGKDRILEVIDSG
jgi:hypothetical protein